MIQASYFDGRTGMQHAVELSIGGGLIRLFGADIVKSIPAGNARIAERYEHTPCIIDFTDGSRCEVHDGANQEQLLAALHYRKSFVQRLQDKWQATLLLTLAMLLALFSAYQWGLPWAVDRIAPRIPLAWEQKLGDEALKALDRSMFRPTSLVDEQQQEVQAIFTGIAPSHSRMPLRLVFRDAPAVGANAIALPNGTIVLTDAMYYRIASAKDGLGGLLGEEMAGVLAHEIGHVQRRHSLRSIIRGSLLGTLSWTLFGDFSVVAAGLPTVLLRMEYSRGMETEADDYAANLLREHGIHPSRLADVFDLLMRTQKDPNAELPSWMRKATSYMSTHPSNDERIARLRQTPSP